LLLRIFFAVAFALLASSLFTGCQSTETAENEASRPWNAPRGWETGLPGFQQDRR
jgi:hypothetical protein